jgi:hypothetical protein
METRTCAICGNEYPLDEKHFRRRVQDGKAYFTSECLLCRQNARKKSAERKSKQREASLKKVEDAAVTKFLSAVTAGGSNIPHSAEVIERVMDYFGGVSGFAAVLVKQYWDSPAGGSARNRLLETLCRLVSKNVEQGGAKKPVSLWSDDELEQELSKRFEQAVAVVTGAVIHVEQSKSETRRLTIQEAEQASDLAAAIAAASAVPDPVRAGQHQGVAERTSRPEVRSVEALPAEPEPRESPRLPGE